MLLPEASWSGWSSPFLARPSIVMISEPLACTARTVQDFTAWPFMMIVQAPHWLVSQPTCVPVRPRTSRRKWTRSRRGSTSPLRCCPLMVIVTFMTTEFLLLSLAAASGRLGEDGYGGVGPEPEPPTH